MISYTVNENICTRLYFAIFGHLGLLRRKSVTASSHPSFGFLSHGVVAAELRRLDIEPGFYLPACSHM